jgi:molecular chaperone Hsp33
MSVDFIQPFQLEAPNLRGRMVRVGPLLDAIVTRHDYPEPVAHLLAETIVLTALLAGMLKYEGIFTLQAKGEGAVNLLVADVTSDGHVRAYAQFTKMPLAVGANARDLLGEGYLAFTVDQGESSERYQGVVELYGRTLSDFVQHYFKQSEQIDSAFEVAVMHDKILGWRAGSIMLQRLPERVVPLKKSAETDDWRRCMVLLDTVTTPELTDPSLAATDLIYRLFHQEEPTAYELQPLVDQCRCSKERVEGMLRALPPDEIEALKAEGHAEVVCEFCSRQYLFPASFFGD